MTPADNMGSVHELDHSEEAELIRDVSVLAEDVDVVAAMDRAMGELTKDCTEMWFGPSATEEQKRVVGDELRVRLLSNLSRKEAVDTTKGEIRGY